MKTRKNTKRYSAGGLFDGWFQSAKNGWEKTKSSAQQGWEKTKSSTSGLFGSKPSTTTTPSPKSQTYSTHSTMSPMHSHQPVNEQTNVHHSSPATFSNPSVPTPIGGRRKGRSKKHYKSKRRYKGGYNLNDSAPVYNEKVAEPTYWITGGKRRKSRKTKIKRKYTRRRKSRKN